MRTPRLALVAVVASSALLAAQSVPQPKFVVPNAADIRIETRRSSDRRPSIEVTDVVYLKGARQRREERFEGKPNNPLNWAHPGMTLARISQCDDRRMLLLNHDAKTYVYEPIADPASYLPSARADRGRQTQPQARPRQQADVPTITLTVDSIDTGERKQFRHYVARHVITTRTTEYSPAEVTVDRQDGWYIDIPQPDCTNWDGVATALTSFLLARDGTNTPPELIIKRRGQARLGYPIEETRHFGGRYPGVSRIELIDISESPLDDAHFTVPADYQAALRHPYGGYDLSKPDTLLNRLQAYREVAAEWANYIRRYGLHGILPGTQPPQRY